MQDIGAGMSGVRREVGEGRVKHRCNSCATVANGLCSPSMQGVSENLADQSGNLHVRYDGIIPHTVTPESAHKPACVLIQGYDSETGQIDITERG